MGIRANLRVAIKIRHIDVEPLPLCPAASGCFVESMGDFVPMEYRPCHAWSRADGMLDFAQQELHLSVADINTLARVLSPHGRVRIPKGKNDERCPIIARRATPRATFRTARRGNSVGRTWEGGRIP